MCLTNKNFDDNDYIYIPTDTTDTELKQIATNYNINIYIFESPIKHTIITTSHSNALINIYIFKDDTKYYNIIINDHPYTEKQTGGNNEEISEIREIMNQSYLNINQQKLLSEKEREERKLNTLSYIVPIRLELYKGNKIPISKKLSIKCKDSYENILNTWNSLMKEDKKQEDKKQEDKKQEDKKQDDKKQDDKKQDDKKQDDKKQDDKKQDDKKIK